MKILRLALASLLSAAASQAAEPTPGQPARTNAPPQQIRITSRDGFEYDLNARSAIYKGNVRVTDPAMKISCDLLKVLFAQNNNTNATTTNVTTRPQPMISGNLGGRVESIAADGRVIITNLQDGSTAVGDKAVYTAAIQTVVLSGGRPSILTTNGNGMIADVITFNRKTGRFSATGSIESFYSSPLIDNGKATNQPAKGPEIP